MIAQAVAEPTAKAIKRRPDPKIVHGRDQYGRAICHGSTKHGPCESKILDPLNGRCCVHGGFGEKGPDHPSYTTGTGSKYKLPPGLAQTFDQVAKRDQDPTSLVEDIRLLDAFTQQALAKLTPEGMDPAMLNFLAEKFTEMKIALEGMPEPPGEDFMGPFRSAFNKVRSGANNMVVEGQIKENMLVKSKLTMSEHKKKDSEMKAITQKEFMVRMVQLVVVIADVCGRDAAQEIGKRLGFNVPSAVLHHARLITPGVGVPVSELSEDEDSDG